MKNSGVSLDGNQNMNFLYESPIITNICGILDRVCGVRTTDRSTVGGVTSSTRLWFPWNVLAMAVDSRRPSLLIEDEVSKGSQILSSSIFTIHFCKVIVYSLYKKVNAPTSMSTIFYPWSCLSGTIPFTLFIRFTFYIWRHRLGQLNTKSI